MLPCYVYLVILLLQVIMPGYCVAGTVGHKILNGAKKLEMENKQTVGVFSSRLIAS